MNIFGPESPPKWSAELCDCGENTGTCLITCCLPCITFGQIAEIVDEGRSSCVVEGCLYGLFMTIACHWIYSCTYRDKLRSKFGLPAEPCCDCCVHFCCDPCALCQEHAELKARGFEPSRGWIGPPNAPPPHMPRTMLRWSFCSVIVMKSPIFVAALLNVYQYMNIREGLFGLKYKRRLSQ